MKTIFILALSAAVFIGYATYTPDIFTEQVVAFGCSEPKTRNAAPFECAVFNLTGRVPVWLMSKKIPQ